MSVVPMSMADIATSPVLSLMDFPATLSSAMESNQKVGTVPLGMFKKSMSPVKSDELVPPRVRAPPSCSNVVAEVSFMKRFSHIPNSGWVNSLDVARACQKGTA